MAHMAMSHLPPRTLKPVVSHARPVASPFPTGMNIPGSSPPNIGTLTSSDGSPTLPPRHPNPRPLILLSSSPASSSTPPVPDTPESHAQPSGPSTETNSTAPPPSKRRRAKRTEEERIQYLRSDPYVAKFDAYRVLCASCDKWIRLRPNSTYCSIPWDAHRKSCLARKGCVIRHSFTFQLLSAVIHTKRPAVPRCRLTGPKIRRHHLSRPTLTPASMTANVFSARSATAGFLSAKRARLPKHGHSTVPSAVPLPRQLLPLHLQSQGLPTLLPKEKKKYFCTNYPFAQISSSSAYPLRHNTGLL